MSRSEWRAEELQSMRNEVAVGPVGETGVAEAPTVTLLQRISLGGGPFSWRGDVSRGWTGAADVPLVVALHGGAYTSAYFDIAGCSLLERAAALRIPIVALDRPGYGETDLSADGDASHSRSAEVLEAAIDDLWSREGSSRAGIVLLGHSIGGAIALRIAARRPGWPLLGVAVSGVGLNNAPAGAENRARLPQTPFIAMPQTVKDRQMFGPVGSYPDAMPAASRAADAPAPRQEVIDISTAWPAEARDVLSRIEVPVHYRQGAQDALWVVGASQVLEFGAACSAARRLDAAVVENCGHCIDLHWAGAGLQLEQLAFALRCATARRFEAERPV